MAASSGLLARGLGLLGRLLPWKREVRPELDVVELRRSFQARYHHFKLLLNANNKSLEVMTEVELALRGGQAYGMAFVRAACTNLAVNVLQIVRNLDQLAAGRYRDLFERFRLIQARIDGVLDSRPPPLGSALVVPLDEVDRDRAGEVGGKMASLGEVGTRMGVAVPPGFVITSLAYHLFLAHADLQAEINRRTQAADPGGLHDVYQLSASIQQLIVGSPVPEEVRRAVEEAYRQLEARTRAGVRVSLRSSALGEDAAGRSFAGQYRSELNVSPESILDAYKQVVASKYSAQAMIYRFNRGIRDDQVAMPVGCMAMVDAVVGGVAYSRSPTQATDDAVFITATWGLPKSVVDGSVRPDLFVVSRDDPPTLVRTEIQAKPMKLVSREEEGLARVQLSTEDGVRPSLDGGQVVRVASLALSLERYWGSPQDVEWALAADGTTYVLQCRPLQQATGVGSGPAEAVPDADGGPSLVEGGVVASPGAAAGPVFLVSRNADLLRFPRGAVLVTAQPLPAWASLLSRAVAVVAEEGGVAGHLASVARELGIPALFGVPGATARLHDGVIVTVDADAGAVYEGRREALLGRRVPRPDPMEASPVRQALDRAAEHIVPLHLLDPDSIDFRPSRCQTYHDITRFCHEKAVWEMFQFGKEHRFPERSGKQLVSDVPMQLWVINLDDGFRQEVEGPQVHLDNVVSVPMLALWEGMRAVPWQGPPPLDARGFMAVLFQATTDPWLDPAQRSRLSDRNYFMVSRSFCSLQSRFGFHFCSVEALAGERALENYASFQFKGGAADYSRRRGRVEFVGSLLEEFGFRVRMREDALFARLEGRDQRYMSDRLKVLGYLIIHTRQLDMIMADAASTSAYRNRMLRELRSLLGEPDLAAAPE